jgi:hypothetical protein
MVMLASAVFAKGTNASLAGPLRFIFCHFDRPISLGSFQNYRRETLHAQVPPEVLTQTSLQPKNPQFQASLLSERMHAIPPRLRESKMEKQVVPCSARPRSHEVALPSRCGIPRRKEQNSVTQSSPAASKQYRSI